jgi:hypothetical protein
MTIDLTDLYPEGWDQHYNEVRAYVISKLIETKSEKQDLLNFHFTPGDDFMNVTKEQMWEELQKVFAAIDRGEYTEIDYVDSNRPVKTGKSQVDVKDLIKDL